jgi:hypothetical protein
MTKNKKYRNRFMLFLFLLLSLSHFSHVNAQRITEKDKNKVFLEGMALYTLILGNWTSNDLYYENEFDTKIVSGYLSYRDKDTLKTIFWRAIDTSSVEYKTKSYKSASDTVAAEQSNTSVELRWILKTVKYKNMSVLKKNAQIPDQEERLPTATERMLMDYRDKAYAEINSDTVLIKQYAGTRLKAVPIDAGKEVRVYIYSSTVKPGVVPIGGDYLLVYDKKTNTLISKEDIHRECIFISTQYKGKKSDLSKATLHTHKPGTAPLITPTDIATLLLYKSQLEWDEHHVVSDKYTSIFSLVDRKLDIMLTKDFEALKEKKSVNDKEEQKYKPQQH